jgi:hypothetical protein
MKLHDVDMACMGIFADKSHYWTPKRLTLFNET